MNAIRDCYELNKRIKEMNLVRLTWGNASVLESGYVYIKPSGIDVERSPLEDSFCKVSLATGENTSQPRKPSVDLDTHLEIYRGFSNASAVIHTHSTYATSFAQAGVEIPCLGTTHADYFNGSIPVVPYLSDLNDYEKDTGTSIVQHYKQNGINPEEVNACLIQGHGVFVWGKTASECLESALVIEMLAEMAYNSMSINPDITFPNHILKKHYERKHGETRYYGQ